MSLNKVRFKICTENLTFAFSLKLEYISFWRKKYHYRLKLNIFDKKTKPSGQVHATLTIMFYKQKRCVERQSSYLAIH